MNPPTGWTQGQFDQYLDTPDGAWGLTPRMFIAYNTDYQYRYLELLGPDDALKPGLTFAKYAVGYLAAGTPIDGGVIASAASTGIFPSVDDAQRYIPSALWSSLSVWPGLQQRIALQLQTNPTGTAAKPGTGADIFDTRDAYKPPPPPPGTWGGGLGGLLGNVIETVLPPLTVAFLGGAALGALPAAAATSAAEVAGAADLVGLSSAAADVAAVGESVSEVLTYTGASEAAVVESFVGPATGTIEAAPLIAASAPEVSAVLDALPSALASAGEAVVSQATESAAVESFVGPATGAVEAAPVIATSAPEVSALLDPLPAAAYALPKFPPFIEKAAAAALAKAKVALNELRKRPARAVAVQPTSSAVVPAGAAGEGEVLPALFLAGLVVALMVLR